MELGYRQKVGSEKRLAVISQSLDVWQSNSWLKFARPQHHIKTAVGEERLNKLERPTFAHEQIQHISIHLHPKAKIYCSIFTFCSNLPVPKIIPLQTGFFFKSCPPYKNGLFRNTPIGAKWTILCDLF